LSIEKTMSEEISYHEYIQSLLQEHGDELCLDHRRVYRLLEEQYSERTPKIVGLHAAVREGIAFDLIRLEQQKNMSSIQLERFSKKLQERTGLETELCSWAVDTWVKGLGGTAKRRKKGVQIQALINPHRKKKIHPLKRPEKGPMILSRHRAPIMGIDFSPNGKWVSTVGFDRTMRIWDGKTGVYKTTMFCGHRDWIRSVSYSTDGSKIATVGDDGGARLWDMNKGIRLQKLIGHEGYCRSLAYSPDGKFLLTGGQDGRALIWDCNSGKQLQSIGPLGGEITSLCFDSLGRWIAIGLAKRVEIWDISKRERIGQHGTVGLLTLVCPGLNGGLFIGDQNGVQWLGEKNRQVKMVFKDSKTSTTAMAVDPAGTSIVVGSKDKKVRVWNTKSGKCVWRFDVNSNITDVAVSISGGIGIAKSNGDADLWIMGREL
jgi:hypothetical protein